MKKIAVIFLLLFLGYHVYSQNYLINQANNGTTVNTCTGDIYDSGGAGGGYSANEDYSMTFCSNSTTNTHIHLYFWAFDILPGDTLYIYDGPSMASPLIGKYNNNNTLFYFPVDATITNTSGCLTLRFKSGAGSAQGAGWQAAVSCNPVCQKVIAKLDSAAMTPHPADTMYVDICKHDTITFVAKGVYPQNNMIYAQNDATSTFAWNFGDGTMGTGQTIKHAYSVVRGYNVSLVITDVQGCASTNALGTRIRISSSPIGRVGTLDTICSGTVLNVFTGTSSLSTISIHTPSYLQTASLTYDSATFIPDGGSLGGQCYNTNVTFNVFNPGQTVQNITDIVSVCVNMEHSYVGDLELSLICPNGQTAILKQYIHSGMAYLGLPYMAPNDQAGDCIAPCASPSCITDPLCNPIGTCWNYCWSMNPSWGDMNNYCNTGNTTPPPTSYTEQMDSGSYLPYQSFANLIGCPLNGTWNFKVCDNWAIDNGWVCSWTLNLDPTILPVNWSYNVLLDTIIWNGPFILHQNNHNMTVRPDTGGNFNYLVHLIDKFGCTYDTNVFLNVIPTPKFSLGNDTALCSGTPVTLHAPTYPYGTYYWLPTNEITQDITVHTTNNYIAIVQTGNSSTQCQGSDTIHVTFNPMPLISFLPDHLSGCEPLTVNIDNVTTPQQASFKWDFGDGSTSTAAQPVHIYETPGTYSISADAKTGQGCEQTYSINNLIHVYAQPKALWAPSPALASLTNPVITFNNATTNATSYLWAFGDGDTSHMFNPVHTYHQQGTYSVWFYAGTEDGCMDSLMKEVVIIDDSLTVPNVITPNGDGFNDYFVIKNLESYPINELVIFDRWGKKIYDRLNYRNDWDGGKSPDGTYFYILRCKGLLKNFESKGSLTVIGKN